MATPHSLRPLVPCLILATLAASEPALAREQAPPSWKDLKQLLEERKPEAALQGTEERLAQARASGDEEEWARALIRAVDLRWTNSEKESAVRFLREQPWPQGLLPHTTLQLFQAWLLARYADSWEVSERERVVSSDPGDPSTWSQAQSLIEAHKAFAELWKEREQLGRISVKALPEYIDPGTYPAGIRDTLRDLVAYEWVDLVMGTKTWRLEQSEAFSRQDWDAMPGGNTPVELTDPAVHPLRNVAAILGDLEAWHRGAGRREAELEVRLARYERLHTVFRREEVRTRIRQHLRAHLERFRDVPWWATGQKLLATLEEDANHLVSAHQSAKAGMGAFPNSQGGRGCAALAHALETREFSLRSMHADGPGRRSIEVTHRNLSRLFFRAYAYDLEKLLPHASTWGLRPKRDELRRLLDQGRPVASWSVELPATQDLQDHRTFVTPPRLEPGTYVIAASEEERFSHEDSWSSALLMTVTPWVAIANIDGGRRIEARVLDGETGHPVPGVEARIFLELPEEGMREVQRTRTDPWGLAAFAVPKQKPYESFRIVVGRGRQALVLDNSLHRSETRTASEQDGALVFTDRSVYRPLQKVHWKVVAFRGSRESARYSTQPDTPVTVSLEDADGNLVEKRQVRTNDFGSAAGEFTLPPGRQLGVWRILTEPSGGAWVSVEEYKRPTFEVVLKDPQVPLRLNRPALLRGEARYFFGLPVVKGTVRWRVSREPVLSEGWSVEEGEPWPFNGPPSVVATGTSALEGDGSFPIAFTPAAEEGGVEIPGLSWRYRVEADVTGGGGETRSAKRTFRVGTVSVEVRVEDDSGFISEGTPAELRLVRSNLDGVPQVGSGSWRLVTLQQPEQPVLPADEPRVPPPGARPERSEERVPTPGDALEPRWAQAAALEDTLRRWPDGAEQARGTVEHDAQGSARLRLASLKPGAYRLRYETVDDFGQRGTTAHEFLVAGTSAPIALPAALRVEKTTLKVGEIARVLAFSGFEGQPLLLELHQEGRRLQRRVLTRGRDSAVLELPVTEALRGGFTVELIGVRDHQLLRCSQEVSVPFDDKALSLEFTSFRDHLRPGGKETWRVTVRGPKGARLESGAAELLASMYDRSLDFFGTYPPPSVARLYPEKAARVNLASSQGFEEDSRVWGKADVTIGERPLEVAQLQFDSVWFSQRERVAMNLERFGDGMLHEDIVPPDPQVEDGIETMVMSSHVPTIPGHAPGESDESPEPRAAPRPGTVPREGLRSNFEETAFWIPQLLTGPDGSATLEFTVPDSVTAWRAWVHAVTRDMKGGSIQRVVRSEKELMVRPYIPRFLREGDQAVLEVVINNASEQRQEGTLTLDILDLETEQSVLSRFGVTRPSQPFTVEPGKGASLRFPLSTPARVGTVAIKVTARAGDLGDGELRPLPVLPGRMHLSESRFVTLRDKGRQELTFEDLRRDDEPSRIHEQLVVTVDARLLDSVLQALPYLVDAPYECTEQTLNRFVSTSIVSSLYGQYPAVAKLAKQMSERPTRLETWDAEDPNRRMALEETPWLQEAKGGPEIEAGLRKVLDPAVARAERAAAQEKLRKAQTPSGGFPWWPGGPPSPYMTLYIAHGLARAAEYKVDVPKDMTQRAWSYLARHFREEYVTKRMKEDTGWEFLTFLNYVASSYPDASYLGSALTSNDRKRILDYSFEHRKELSPYLKGYLALTLKRAGRRTDAERVWESVMDSAMTSPELGTHWAPEDRSWLWYNDTTETQAFALRTLTELKPKDPRRDGLVQWLLLDKKLGHWKSTRATAEALYALVKYLEQEGALGIREDAKVTVGDKTVEFFFEPDKYTGKKNQVVIPGPEVDPVKSSKVVVEKTSKGFAFASATWQFSTEKLPTEERGDFFQVSRRYFLRESQGKEATLRPLAEGAKLAPGDEVEVQLSLRTKHEAEYVHLRDPRAAGLEPENAVSHHEWDQGLLWYEETRDSGTNFFFEWLPAGEYTFKYRLRANMAGTFRVGPATVQSMYAPEFTAWSTGAVLTVGG